MFSLNFIIKLSLSVIVISTILLRRSNCSPSCPPNEVWNSCGNPCNDQWCNQTEPRICTQECRKEGGCYCLEGLKRNNAGLCVNCTTPCPIYEVWDSCGNPCVDKLCTECEKQKCPKICKPEGSCHCRVGLRRNSNGQCIKCCPKDEVWDSCGNPCFDHYCNRTEPTFCPLYCLGEGGCYCPAGLKRNAAGKCVKC